MVARVSMTHAELGAYIAREIFKAGDEPTDKVQRISFRGGMYSTGGQFETDLGGMCEGALADHIRTTLDDLSTGGER